MDIKKHRSKTCKHCGQENSPASQFCSNCGIPFKQPKPAEPEPLVCSSCGANNKPNANYCAHCGYDFGADEAAPTPEATPEVPRNSSEVPEKDAKQKRRRTILFVAALLLGAPLLLLSIANESTSPGTAVGQYLGGFFWGFIIGLIVKIFVRKASLADYAIWGGLILNGGVFLLLIIGVLQSST